MRYALLVAFREFAENVKTKGFWIGIFVFPVIITLSFSVEGWLEKAKPVRNYVLVDHSGRYEGAIEAALERRYQRRVFSAFAEYVRANAVDPGGEKGESIDLERTPADALEGLQRWGKDNPDALELFVKEGGVETALELARPRLRPDAPEFSTPRRDFRRVPLPADLPADLSKGDDVAALGEALKPYLRGQRSVPVADGQGELFAAVLIPADVDDLVVRPGQPPAMPGTAVRGIQYWSVNLADEDLKDEIEEAANTELRRREYEQSGLDAASVEKVQRTHLVFASLNPKKTAGQEQVSVADKIRQWAPMGFVYLLWIGIFSISQMLLNNTIEEKSNRIIEVLLSSVTPGELMMGKLMGIAAVGLTMIAAWVGSLMAILAYKAGEQARLATELLKVLKSSGLLPSFLVYFLLGYLFYAGAFLAIGSLCNTLKEAQNLMQPIMIVMIVPLFTMTFIPKDPNGTVATVMSWIPPYTPFIMMNRAAADPPMVERIGTLILLLVSTGLVLWLSGRIFRLGILRTGQPPKLKELVRWLRTS
jgi:ABC-2 type transport system permease protein